MGYETKVVQGQSTVFGVAATRARLYPVAIQTRQPRTLNFGERLPSGIWDTWIILLPQCRRKPECASAYVFDDDDPVVLAELEKVEGRCTCTELLPELQL